MDLAAQLSALGAEARRQAEWDQVLYSALADYQAQISQARSTLASRLAQAVSPSPPQQRPPPTHQAMEEEIQQWRSAATEYRRG